MYILEDTTWFVLRDPLEQLCEQDLILQSRKENPDAADPHIVDLTFINAIMLILHFVSIVVYARGYETYWTSKLLWFKNVN